MGTMVKRQFTEGVGVKPTSEKPTMNTKGSNIMLRAIGDRVIVEPIESETKTPGGLIIPDAAKEKPSTGRVVVAGSGERTKDGVLIPLEVKIGDIVLYQKFTGTDVTIDGKKYIVFHEKELLAIMEA